ncbi:hypothetical protein KIN20_022147, partial [Parelaphostrongylus tenuis]
KVSPYDNRVPIYSLNCCKIVTTCIEAINNLNGTGSLHRDPKYRNPTCSTKRYVLVLVIQSINVMTGKRAATITTIISRNQAQKSETHLRSVSTRDEETKSNITKYFPL